MSADANGHLVHTNHYACERMERFEGDPRYAEHSRVRAGRAAALLASAEPGTINAERMRSFLADHANEADAICRHPERTGGAVATVFWWVADLTEMTVRFGRGNPCDSSEQQHRFASVPAA